ncbi:MAG: hypothetical protein Q4E13_07370, partial [Clostridia bacterium]|nr:hypothetical protein [Clostridia bacterium]
PSVVEIRAALAQARIPSEDTCMIFAVALFMRHHHFQAVISPPIITHEGVQKQRSPVKTPNSDANARAVGRERTDTPSGGVDLPPFRALCPIRSAFHSRCQGAFFKKCDEISRLKFVKLIAKINLILACPFAIIGIGMNVNFETERRVKSFIPLGKSHI